MVKEIIVSIVFGMFGGLALMVFNTQRDTVDPLKNLITGFIVVFLISLIFLK